MTRKQAVVLLIAPALLAMLLAATVAKRNITFSETVEEKFGIQHMDGAGNYQFGEGETLNLVVKNPAKLTKSLGIKGLKNGEHLLLRHVKDDRFELSHKPSGQKAPLRLALSKGAK